MQPQHLRLVADNPLGGGVVAVDLQQAVAVLRSVEVEVLHRRENDAVARLERLRQRGAHPTAPPLHDGRRREVVARDLVPADQLAAVGSEEGLHLAHEPRLQSVLVTEPVHADARLALGTVRPGALLHLVGPQVHILEGKELEDLLVDVLRKLQRRVVAQAERRGEGLAPGRLPGARKGREALDDLERVARHVQLGNDVDAQCRGVGHHFADLLLRVAAAVERAAFTIRAQQLPGQPVGRIERLLGPFGTGDVVPVRRRVAPGALLRQRGIAADLDAPALIVGQMPVELVELVFGHPQQQRLDLLLGEEVARHVEHAAAPGVAGRILDLDGRDRRPASRRGELPQRGDGRDRAAVASGGDADPVRRDPKAVGALAERAVECQHDVALVPERRSGKLRPGKRMGQEVPCGKEEAVAARHRQAFGQAVFAAGALHLPGCGNQVERHVRPAATPREQHGGNKKEFFHDIRFNGSNEGVRSGADRRRAVRPEPGACPDRTARQHMHPAGVHARFTHQSKLLYSSATHWM